MTAKQKKQGADHRFAHLVEVCLRSAEWCVVVARLRRKGAEIPAPGPGWTAKVDALCAEYAVRPVKRTR